MSYNNIQEYVKKKYGFVPKSCWIAHAKELCGLNVRKSWNRRSDQRKYPCPEDKLVAIKDALKNFGLL